MVEPSLTAYLHGEHRAPQVNATRHQLQRNADTRSRFWLMCSARKSGRQAREGRRELPRSTAHISQGAGMPPPLSDWLSWPFWSHTGPRTEEAFGRAPCLQKGTGGCQPSGAPSRDASVRLPHQVKDTFTVTSLKSLGCGTGLSCIWAQNAVKRNIN